MRIDCRHWSGLGFKQALPSSGVIYFGSQKMTPLAVATDRFAVVAAQVVADKINHLQFLLGRPVNLFITPGNTMVGFLDKLANPRSDDQVPQVDWDGVRLWSIGEFAGIIPFSALSYNNYIRRYFIEVIPEQIRISGENYFPYDEKFYPEPQDYLMAIEKAGGLDLGIVGIGQTYGDLGFNMPDTPFDSTMSLLHLSQETVAEKGLLFAAQQNRRAGHDWWAWMLGLGDIFKTRELVLLARGQGKQEIVKKALLGPVTTRVPASILQLHPDLTVILDQEAAPSVSPYRMIEPGAARRLVREFGNLSEYLTEQVAEDMLERYLGLVVSEAQMREVLRSVSFEGKFVEAAERDLQLGILIYYHKNLADILDSVSDSEGREKIHELFLKAVRVYKLPLVKSEVLMRKEIFSNHLLTNIRSQASALGNLVRSDEAFDLTVHEVLASTDSQVFMPAMESILEVLAFGRKYRKKTFQDRLQNIIKSMAQLPRYAYALVDFLERAEKQKVSLNPELFKNPWEFYHESRELILELVADNPAVALQMTEYLDCFEEMGREFAGAQELILQLGRGHLANGS